MCGLLLANTGHLPGNGLLCVVKNAKSLFRPL